ncbi:hypothetical protein M405DRAFT_870207 [Rhizopogon salebrosus TDB-379]|nr:hypothetical protein M405DRAFT_870207 [Rhizopogon salebrosus TDB-379]
MFPPSALEPLPLPGNDVFGTGRPEPSSSGTATPGSLFTFWHRESTEERLERNSWEFEELSRTREQRELHAEHTEAMRKARKRADDCERQQKHRDVVRDEKIASGWKPYQKRKFIEDLDTVSSQKIEGAELSRPRRQFKEDRKAHNKPQGRKRKILQQQARRMNWQSPFVWAQIEIAARKAGKPWSPRAILKEA